MRAIWVKQPWRMPTCYRLRKVVASEIEARPRGSDRGRGCRGHRLPGGHRQIASRPGAGSAQAETHGLREGGASVRTTHVAEGPAVKNQSAEVSHSPRRIENKRPPATGSTQGANLVDRTISTLATTAP